MAGRSRILVAGVIGQACLVAIGVIWWVANLGIIPPYGDTRQYFELSESLKVDQYRTLFYPLLLRGLRGSARLLHTRIELVVDLLQTAAALMSVAYLGRALWDVAATTTRFAFLGRVSPTNRRLVIGASAVVVFTEPLVNHFALSVMTDSLAASFTTAGVAALVRIAVLGETRLRNGIVGWLTIFAASFMRTEKVLVFASVIALALAVLAAWGPRATGPGGPLSRRRRLRIVALLATLLVTPGAVVFAINRATQTADYGWPPATVAVRLFVRTTWPHLADIRPQLSPEAQATLSAADASRFDGNYNEYLSLVPRLLRSAGGTDRLINEISLVALRRHGVDIAASTAVDALRNVAPMIAYPVDIAVSARSASRWTDSRMSMAHPRLTRIYLVVATIVLVAVQLPLLFLALIRRAGREPRIAFAAVLVIGTALANAVLYAMLKGQQNVRYAMTAYVLVYTVLVWANVAVIADGRRPSVTDGAEGSAP